MDVTRDIVCLVLRAAMSLYEDFVYHREFFSGSNYVVLEYSARVADQKLKGIHFDEGGKRCLLGGSKDPRVPLPYELGRRNMRHCLRVEVDAIKCKFQRAIDPSEGHAGDHDHGPKCKTVLMHAPWNEVKVLRSGHCQMMCLKS
jgi:hypothetical protein